MNKSLLGTTLIAKGQLVTLYLENVEDDRPQRAVILYATKDFNLSEAMATYYSLCQKRQKVYKSEAVLQLFVEYLMEQGYVEHPNNETVSIGVAGRPPVRMIDEFKYSKNPSAFMMEKINGVIRSRCIGFFNARSKYFNLMDPDICPFQIRCDITIDGVFTEVLTVGLSPSTKGTMIHKDDCPKIKELLQKLFDEEFKDIPVVVHQVFTPTYEDIQIHRTLEKSCKN